MAQLLEETLERPVKYAFSLSKESFALNKGFFLTYAAILIVLGILGMIPIVNLFTSILSGILTAALTIAVGQRFVKAESIDDYIEKIKTLRIGQVWSDHAGAATGAYLGFILLTLLFALPIIFMGFLFGGSVSADALFTQPIIVLYILLAAALFLYVAPLIYAYVIEAQNFGEGFRATWRFFSKELWQRAFKKGYFNYMFKLGLILIALSILIVIVFAIIGVLGTLLGNSGAIIVMGIAMIATLVLQVWFSIFYAIASAISKRITE